MIDMGCKRMMRDGCSSSLCLLLTICTGLALAPATVVPILTNLTLAVHKEESAGISRPDCCDACRMGVVNRDIKLENILLKTYDTHPILKICDFGYSINENHSLPKTALGTPGYTGTSTPL